MVISGFFQVPVGQFDGCLTAGTSPRAVLWGFPVTHACQVTVVRKIHVRSRGLCCLLSSTELTLGTFHFQLEASACAKQPLAAVLPHGQAREPPKGPCNRWRGLYPTVKWLGWGNARVSLPARIHILDFPGVTGFLWSQSHTPFLWSFSLPPEEDIAGAS